MSQNRRDFIKTTTILSGSAMPAMKTLAASITQGNDDYEHLIDGNFNSSLEFNLIDNNLLNLHFYFINVNRVKKFLYPGPGKHAYMIVRLPQFHLSESGFWNGYPHNHSESNLSGFSFLAFRLWPNEKVPVTGGKGKPAGIPLKQIPFQLEKFLDWNKTEYFELITLVEWFALKQAAVNVFPYADYLSDPAKFFQNKSFGNDETNEINVRDMPKSWVFAKYHRLVEKFLEQPLQTQRPANADFVPVTLFELPQGAFTVPLYRNKLGELGADKNELVKKQFWPNELTNQLWLKNRPNRYEVWNNTLFLKRQNINEGKPDEKEYRIELPSLRIIGLFRPASFVYRARAKDCTEQSIKDDAAVNILPSLLDKTELTYLMQYAKSTTDDFTKPEFDLKVKDGLFFTGLGVITHLVYSNRNCPTGIDLIEYEHKITQGRDVFIKVSRLGYNSKTGQPYKHTIEGQRVIELDKISDGNYDPVSFIMFKQYCECLDPEFDYTDAALDTGKFEKLPAIAPNKLVGAAVGIELNRLRLPFKQVVVKEKIRIPIDCLTDHVIKRTVEDLEALNWFWPIIENDANFTGNDPTKPGKTDTKIPLDRYLPCDHDTNDHDDQLISACTPFMFIRKCLIEGGDLAPVYQNYCQGEYHYPDEAQDKFVERRRTYYNGQKIAYTPSTAITTGSVKAFDSKVNQIETAYTETYFNIRTFAPGELVSKTRYVVFPQLLHAKVFLDHIRDLTQQKIPSYIDYHKAYLKSQFDEVNNRGAQIVQHIDGFRHSLESTADQAEKTLNRERDKLVNALQEAKDKLGNIAIPDIGPETVSLKKFGITLPQVPDFHVINSIPHLDPKTLLTGKFAEILGGFDLKMLLNDLLPEAETPLFQLAKTAADNMDAITNSPVYREIQADIEAVKREINKRKDQYDQLVKAINDTKTKINEGLKIIAANMPDAEQVRNFINRQFEQYRNQLFDVVLKDVLPADLPAKLARLEKDAREFMKDQVTYYQDRIATYQKQLADCHKEIAEILAALPQDDIDHLPAELAAITGQKIDDYINSKLLPAFADVLSTAGVSFSDGRVSALFDSVELTVTLTGAQTATLNIDIYFDPDTLLLTNDNHDTPVKILTNAQLAVAGFAQVAHMLDFFRTLILKNSNGTAFQQDAVKDLQAFFKKGIPSSYIDRYNALEKLVQGFQDTRLGSISQELTKWKNRYELFDQAAVSLLGRQKLTDIHDRILKIFPWIDSLRRLDPYFYYQEFLRLKKDAEDIRSRLQHDIADAYNRTVGDGRAIVGAAKELNGAYHQFRLDGKLGNLNSKITDITDRMNKLSDPVLDIVKELPAYQQAKAQLDLLNGYVDSAGNAVTGLVAEVKQMEKDYIQVFAGYSAYVRDNAGMLTGQLTEIIGKFIARHPQEVALINEARNIYLLLNSIKQQELNYTWSTTGFRDVNLGLVSFKTYSSPKTQLSVNVKATTYFSLQTFPPAIERVETYAQNVLSNFGIGMFGILTIVFNEVSYTAESGKSPHYAVKIKDVRFDGALAFVQKLEAFLKTLDAGLILHLEADHVALGYSLPIPAIQTPAFSFFNLTLAFDFRLYFDKRPMRLGFSFATPENKFGIAVFIFAGFGYFSIQAEPKRGIVVIDAALEAGVWAGFSLGPIHGEVRLAFGFRYTKGDFGVRMEGYIVAEGRLAIWFIEVSARIYLGIISQNSSAEGSCTVTYSVKLGFFKKSFSGTFYKKIAGAETNHQQEAEASYQSHQEFMSLMHAQVSVSNLRTGANTAAMRTHALRSKAGSTKAAFLQQKKVDAETYVTETYAVSEADWEEYFNRFE